MVDKRRYPHKLTYSLPDSGGEYNEETGTYTPVVPGATIELVCRAAPNGQGKYIQGNDGKKVEYSFDLAFPLGIAPPPERTIVEIFGVDGSKMQEGELIRCQVGVFSIRGWV